MSKNQINWGDEIHDKYYNDAEDVTATQFNGIIDNFVPRKVYTGTVVDLACGRGRWTNYLNTTQKFQKIYSIDREAKNVDICKKRFENENNVEIILNDGYSIPVMDECVDFIFSFDSMVHFDIDIIVSYLLETRRVLKVNGTAFFHHSNYSSNINESITKKPHFRNFMDKDLFAKLSEYAGLSVVNQKTIDWAFEKNNLDCLSLLKKSRK